MISEKKFCSSFSSFWQELLPMLTPNYIHYINDTYRKHLFNSNGNVIPEVKILHDLNNPSFISEFAYNLSKFAKEKGVSVKEIIMDKLEVSKIQNYTEANLKYLYSTESETQNFLLSEIDIQYSFAIALNYDYFYSLFPSIQLVEYQPKIRGAGIINNCSADISMDNILVEVKTVNRNIWGSDIKQLLVYLALQYHSGKIKWDHSILFNPRRAVYHLFEVDTLIYKISGDKTSVDIYEQIIDFALELSMPNGL